MKKFRLDIPLWPARVYVVVASDVSEAAKALYPGGDADAEALTLYHRGKLTILLPRKASDGLIAHECIHAACEILKRCKVRFSYRDQEPLCYLAGWLTEKIARKI